MKKLSTKFITYIAIAIITAIVINSATIISLFVSFNNNNLIHSAEISLNVLKKQTQQINTRIDTMLSYYDANESVISSIPTNNTEILKTTFNFISESDYDFCAVVNSSGQIVWTSDNFNLSSFDFKKALSGEITKDFYNDENVPLSYQICGPIKYKNKVVGAVLIGYDFASDEYINECIDETGSDFTVFSGDIRYSTSIKDEDGNKLVGYPMNEDVKKIVIDQKSEFANITHINGKSFFACYEPLLDSNGNYIGAYFAGQDREENLKLVNIIIIVCIGICIVVFVIIYFLTKFFMKKSVTEPLSQLNTLAEQMSTGQLNTPDLTYNFGKNELAHFSDTLHTTKHTLSTYINDISSVLTGMANSDFTSKPSLTYLGDFEEINKSFNKINTNIQKTMMNIERSSKEVMIGSKQVADGSQLLAAGTTEQANSIVMLNNTISKINEDTNSSAENARKANDLSSNVINTITIQNEQMERMLEAMSNIQSTSDKISNIIKTIDDIAFQTNILALNAAVEAARAGSAGKGFAVVADEVRNLASKSAQAAKITNELITASIQAVNDGSEIANYTAEKMKEVMSITNDTNDLIQQISNAAQSQSAAISQVTSGIEQISQVIQQNSATAEESAASSEELSGQARLLEDEISTIKV